MNTFKNRRCNQRQIMQRAEDSKSLEMMYLLGTTFFLIYKQPVYKQLGLVLQKVKQLLVLKHVTISNFANKIFSL